MARRKRNSQKANLILAVVLHGLAVLAIFFFAAREGLVGNTLKEITVAIVPKEKPKPPEEKPPEARPVTPPKEETPKEEPPKMAQSQPQAPMAPPPAADTGPAVAPAAALPADFSFGDGAKVVETSTNAPVAFYRNFVEYTLRSRWNRPADIEDENYVAEVEVEIDPTGKVKSYAWKKTTGNKRWDDSVAAVMAGTKSISRQPPKDFPPKFLVRFDVVPATEAIQ